MKIALPTREGVIDNHFGHCAYYTIFTIENKTIVAEETLAAPQGCGCKSNIATELAQMGVLVLLGGNMGDGARNVLNSNGIEVIRGCSGPVRSVAEAWLRNELVDTQIACSHDEEGHSCSHQH